MKFPKGIMKSKLKFDILKITMFYLPRKYHQKNNIERKQNHKGPLLVILFSIRVEKNPTEIYAIS